MLTIGIIAMFSIFAAAAELPGLWRNRYLRDAVFFSALLLGAAGMGIVYAMRLPLPNPMDGLVTLYEPLSQLVNRLLGQEDL
ncbi:hypothetical protein [Paenibacillus sp. YYML68]|uniref:hypothetical protein n=1 Tax=Paenibacillus sp. YYML68 TaxID=2909250 RepID=UPI002491329E|nr:hypothetical protein [Paenibacillus sp. YYML68]